MIGSVDSKCSTTEAAQLRTVRHLFSQHSVRPLSIFPNLVCPQGALNVALSVQDS